MAIDDLDKIDLLVTDNEKTLVRLIITDHLDWEEFDEGPHLEVLQDKINAYLHFVEDGQLHRERPDLKGLPVIIEVAAKYAPSEEALKFYRLAGPLVAEGGASLQLKVGSGNTTTQRF
jgi:hypothetical protein